VGRSVTDYVPHSELDVRAMLEAVGARSIDDLFDDIPEAVRRREPLALPAGLSEPRSWRSCAASPARTSRRRSS
jgi:glycine dehydrogenase subunit 1